MNNNKGFTLIELVIVIVILGILAATAAPKFIDLTGDARDSVMEGVQGSVSSAVDIGHAKALIAGATTAGDNVSAAGTTFTVTAGGWPNAATINNLVQLDSNGDITAVAASGATASWQHEGASIPADCSIVYTESSDADIRPDVAKSGTFDCQ